jgi:heterodisulfide reductase subunit C
MSKTIRLDSKDATKFAAKIQERSGESIDMCFQCGECSSACPVSSDMDLMPSTLVRFTQLGLKYELINAKTIWVCASCFHCVARCPKGIDIAKVAEALRQELLRKQLDYVEVRDLSIKERQEIPQIAIISNLRKFSR